jgi:preprotein translocase subunit SecD
MFKMFNSFLIVGAILFSAQAFSQTSSDTASNHALIFQIIQDEFVMDNSTVKNALIVEAEGGVYQGLNIQLKPEAATLFADMTKAGTGRRMNLVFNKVIITASVLQSSLGDSFLISGISKQDAQAFLNVLNANKPKPKEE